MAKIDKIYKTYAEFRVWCFEFLGKTCTKCGSTDSLEIDHVDRMSKDFDVSKKWASKSTKEMLIELAKCQTLCSNCHREKSNQEMSILML